MRISVVGLGKLGASMVGALALRGHDVVGVDIDARAVELLGRGESPIEETGLAEIVGTHRSRIRTTHDVVEAVHSSDLTFVVVPTPSLADGSFSVEYARAAFADVGRALATKDGYHLVVLTSTVLPGATRNDLLPVLQEASGKRVGDQIGLCYSPEFIALGSVVNDFLNPDFLLIGEHDERAGARLAECYAEIVLNEAPVRRMSLENAEVAKIALNSFVTMKITFANLLADICESVPGGDVDTVASAIGLDRRIGSRYLRGGLGYGGPCFPRDNQAIAFSAKRLGVDPAFFTSTDTVNRARPLRILARAADRLQPGHRVAVLGLAYKPGSGVLEASQGLELALGAAERGCLVSVFDPLVPAAALAAFPALRPASSAAACVQGAETVIVANDDPAFLPLPALPTGAVVIDCWRRVDRTLQGIEIRRVGAWGELRDQDS